AHELWPADCDDADADDHFEGCRRCAARGAGDPAGNTQQFYARGFNDGLMQQFLILCGYWTCFPNPSLRQARYFALIRAAVSSLYIVTAMIRWAYTVCLSPQLGHCASWRTSSFIRARSVSVSTLTVTPHLQRHVATPLFINLGLLRQVAVIPNMGINPRIGTTCYGKEGVIENERLWS